MKKFVKKFKKVHFQFPKRTEVVLLVLAVFSLFLLDVAQNKVLDLGEFYEVHILPSITVKAISVFWVGILFYLLFTILLLVYAINRKKTSQYWDVTFALIGLFGLSVISAGAIAGIYSDTIPFINLLLAQITFYHIFGILPQILMLLYFAFTD